MTTKPNLPIEMIEVESPGDSCCNRNCREGRDCPVRRAQSFDAGSCKIHAFLLTLAGFWAVAAISMVVFGVMS
jgi:hypothetical protein